MNHRGLLVAWLTLAIPTVVSDVEAQQRSTDLARLAANLDVTPQGVRRWLQLLGAGAADEGAPTERLLAVSPTGKLLMERQGESSSVRVDPELNTLLRRADMEIVLVHNHPASVGLSADDLRQLTKPGVAAIVAIGHNGSVYIASAGPRLDPLDFDQRQYARAKTEIEKRLRLEWPSGRLSVAVSDAHFSHLVATALAKAEVVRYWFKLRGASVESYERARFIFHRVSIGAAGGLQRERAR